MMCGAVEDRLAEWRATVAFYQNSGGKGVFDANARLFWCFLRDIFSNEAGELLKSK
jgi:hypothetical protein